MKARTKNENPNNRIMLFGAHSRPLKPSLQPQIALLRLFACLTIISCFGAADVSALTYKSTVSPEFTIANAITIEVPSGGIVISDLVPGNAKESDEATITIYSNNVGGYTLNASVGEETSPHNTRSLVNTSDNNATFSSINFGSSLSALTDPGTWGYSYSADGTNWAGYNGLPLYTDTKNVATLKDTSSSTAEAGDTVKMKIAAYADSAQTAGTYDNVINFAAVGKAAPTATYIQDYTLSQCSTEATDNVTVVDRRDNNEYTVKYINNECWMTQNLRITGTISATDSNFSGSDFNVSAYDLKTNGGSGGQCNGSNGYSAACSRTPDATDLSTIGGTATAESVGAWYNYYAASAGTISGSSNNTAATSDICPSGWHLPTGPNTTSGTDYNKLVGNTTSGWQNPTAGLTAFGAVPGGYYLNGSLDNTGYGYWWSATAYNTTGRYNLLYNSSNGQFLGNVSNYRYYGRFVRCVRSS